jgi:hypothetical protein
MHSLHQPPMPVSCEVGLSRLFVKTSARVTVKESPVK